MEQAFGSSCAATEVNATTKVVNNIVVVRKKIDRVVGTKLVQANS